jgi:uncharacterized protein
MKKIISFAIALLLVIVSFTGCTKDSAYKTLIITGQNNHNWQASSPVLKQILDETGMFKCDILTTPAQGGDMSVFKPDFTKYRLVVLDYNGDSWSENTNKDFTKFVQDGGGVVVYHAADNSFPKWKEYNEMTGLGGWGDRNEKDGPYVYYKNDSLVTDATPGIGGTHGKRREFIVRTRQADHPIMQGLPARWFHATDELYSLLRGPAMNLQVLATAFADSAAGGGTMRDEPILMTITYGKGRIFHTVLGHADEGGGPAMHCAGFIVTLQRGAEWAVTGNVTQKVPWDFPSAAGVVLRDDFKELTVDEAITGLASYTTGKSTKNLVCLQSYLRGLAEDLPGMTETEKKLDRLLEDKTATTDAKKLVLKELSWMGSQSSVDIIKKLSESTELKDEALYALARIQNTK